MILRNLHLTPASSAMIRGKLLLAVLALALAGSLTRAGAAPTQFTTINFDDLTDNGAGTPIENGYQGFQWTNFSVINVADSPTIYGPNGLANAFFLSPPNAGYDSPFTLNQISFSAQFMDGLNVEVEGLDGNTVLYSTSVLVDTTGVGVVFYNFDTDTPWAGINTVEFSPSGGTLHSGYTPVGNGEQFDIDNVMFTPSPEPGSTFLALGGGLTLLAMLRRRGVKGASAC
jgi:hypothetical protein